MQILSVKDPSFAAYGRVIDGYDTTALLEALEANTPKPADSVLYYPSVDALEALPIFDALKNRFYGGMPIQVGCCNGSNTKLNCLEYHRDSELNIGADDFILLLALESDIVDGKLDTAKVKAFKAEKGQVIEVYATSLHYAPCNAAADAGFRVVIVLPKGTNLDKPEIVCENLEDTWLFAANKWLLAHPTASEADNGAYVGLTGENIDIAALI